MTYNKLTHQEEDIIEGKGTESPFSGEYDQFFEDGTYICRKCNAPLFSSESKFDAGCGWPSFDEEYPDSLKRLPDLVGPERSRTSTLLSTTLSISRMGRRADGEKVEIQCANCGAHLGHEFKGEKFTLKDTRHCVNSLAIKFIPDNEKLPGVLHQ